METNLILEAKFADDPSIYNHHPHKNISTPFSRNQTFFERTYVGNYKLRTTLYVSEK